MSTLDRRYDIDWLRVIAIGLLLVYHTAICFQPWGFMLGFITNDKAIEALWIPMAMLNLWRIPILFFIMVLACFSLVPAFTREGQGVYRNYSDRPSLIVG